MFFCNFKDEVFLEMCCRLKCAAGAIALLLMVQKNVCLILFPFDRPEYW